MMPDTSTFLLFLIAAAVVAATPGPGLFYVAARTLAGGRAEGLASSFGTGIGGLAHVIAGAVGLSALVMASAQAFTVLKIAGALYLIWLGVKTWQDAGRFEQASVSVSGASCAVSACHSSSHDAEDHRHSLTWINADTSDTGVLLLEASDFITFDRGII